MPAQPLADVVGAAMASVAASVVRKCCNHSIKEIITS